MEEFRLVGHHDQDLVDGKVRQHLKDIVTNRPVEACGWFIEKQHFRLTHQLHRQGKPPLLATTESLWCLSQINLGEANPSENLALKLTVQSSMTETKFLGHGQPQEMSLRELIHHSTKPTPLALIHWLVLP